MTNQIKIDTFEAPSHWASAFINGDCSSFDDREQAEFDAWCAANPDKGWVVDCSEESRVGRWNGLLTYTYHAR